LKYTHFRRAKKAAKIPFAADYCQPGVPEDTLFALTFWN
jgi:hypothetical protein